jgi:ribokinase
MKILSIGAVLMDQVAQVARFPREDDEVFVPKLELIPGGSAANFAVLCARLGAETGFIGKVGKDALGQALLDDLETEDVNTDSMAKSKLPTGTVFIAVRLDGERMMFAHSGAANDLNEDDIDAKYFKEFGHLHLADLENIKVLHYAAKNFKGTVSLNPGALIAEKPDEAKELVKHVDFLICSEEEAEKMAGESSLGDCIKSIHALGPKIVIVTRGKKPTMAFDGKNLLELPVRDVPVLDTTGAGDSFSAGFVVEYIKTKDVKRSVDFANAVSSIIIQNKGARGGLINREQVEEILG